MKVHFPYHVDAIVSLNLSQQTKQQTKIHGRAVIALYAAMGVAA